MNVKIIVLNKRSQSQNCILYDSIYIKFRNCKLTYYDVNHFSSYLRLGMKGENRALQKDTSKLLDDDNVLYLDGYAHLSKLTELFILN